MCLQVRLNESDMKTLTREELCARCVYVSCYVTVYNSLRSDADCTYFFSGFRWKQHEAYVQMLEAKYADLNCKFAYPQCCE